MRAALLLTLLASALETFAAPAPRPASVLSSALTPGRTPLAPGDMRDIARLAKNVNEAYCPRTRVARLEPASQFRLAGGHRSTVLASSKDTEFDNADAPQMSWYISHTPSTGVLSLSFSSLPNPEALVSILSPSPSAETSMLALPLPSYLFPSLHERSRQPRVHTAFLPALETHGAAAFGALLDVLAAPSAPVATSNNIFENADKYVARRGPQAPTRIEITGHGLGAATALLVSAALRLELSTLDHDVPVTATLFSLPRIGDVEFSRWLNELAGENYRLQRVTSYADAIPHLPSRDSGLVHPRAATEVFVGANPRDVSVCVPEADEFESGLCAAAVEGEKSNLLDHAGPFAGVWIRGECA